MLYLESMNARQEDELLDEVLEALEGMSTAQSNLVLDDTIRSTASRLKLTVDADDVRTVASAATHKLKLRAEYTRR